MANKKMMKTSNLFCKGCIYGTGESSGRILCNYYLMTKNHRNCKVGECDKYEPKTKENMRIRQDFNDAQFGIRPGIEVRSIRGNYLDV